MSAIPQLTTGYNTLVDHAQNAGLEVFKYGESEDVSSLIIVDSTTCANVYANVYAPCEDAMRVGMNIQLAGPIFDRLPITKTSVPLLESAEFDLGDKGTLEIGAKHFQINRSGPPGVELDFYFGVKDFDNSAPQAVFDLILAAVRA